MKKLLILSAALLVLAGCKGSVPQSGGDYVAPAAPTVSRQPDPMAAALCQDAKAYTAASREPGQPQLPALARFAAACAAPPSPGRVFTCTRDREHDFGYSGLPGPTYIFSYDCADTWFGSVIHGWPRCSLLENFCTIMRGTF